MDLAEISNGVFVGEDPFDIEKVRNWRPYNAFFIFGNLRHVYYRISIVGAVLTLMVASGKLKSRAIRNPKPHEVEFSPNYLLVYFVPKEDVKN